MKPDMCLSTNLIGMSYTRRVGLSVFQVIEAVCGGALNGIAQNCFGWQREWPEIFPYGDDSVWHSSGIQHS